MEENLLVQEKKKILIYRIVLVILLINSTRNNNHLICFRSWLERRKIRKRNRRKTRTKTNFVEQRFQLHKKFDILYVNNNR